MKRYEFEAQTRAMLEALPAPLGIYQFVEQRVVTLVLSDGFRKLFQFDTLEEAYAVMRNDMYSTAHPDDAARLADTAFRFATRGEPYEVVYRMQPNKSAAYRIVHALGEHRWMDTGERLAYVWYMDEGSYAVGPESAEETVQDSFRRVLREESLVHQSYFDGLTGMPNMTYFFNLAKAAQETLRDEKEQIAVLYIDLSGMKFFNSRHGFAEGDKLLRAFAKALARRFSNENCSRFGSDHFAVYTRAEGLEEELERLFAEAAQLNEGRSLPVRVGIYLVSEDEADMALACDKASYACEELKGSFHSSYRYFTESMLSTAENRRYIVEHLDQALREHWIQVHYQPIVRAANGRVCDEEALARWIDPVKGFLSPAEFIPAIEDARLIYKLDLYIVDQVIERFRLQRAEGLYVVPVSVNLSRYDFETCDIVEEIRRRVDEAGVGREMITIEVTESVIGSNFEFMKEQVERFQALGFQVWMDDFGSGYSSLDVMQSIRFDLMKLDMRFMERFDEGEESRIILTELIKMAIGLGIDTVCEGVETREQADFLKEVGCTKLQGYYYCKPLPFEDVLERYRSGTAIGFENPEETDYYAAIGRINLYDMTTLGQGEQENLRRYFDTIPMAILESNGEEFMVVRCNSTYRGFMEKLFGIALVGIWVPYSMGEGRMGYGFLKAMRRCGLDGNRIMIDEEIGDGTTAHAFLKRVAVNPVKGTAAVAVAVLSIKDNQDPSAVSFAHIAKALSSDYSNLFYVDLDTEQFAEFRSDAELGDLALERHGEHFFESSREDAKRLLYDGDVDEFVRVFTRERVIQALDEVGVFTMTYRQMVNGKPVYMNLKAVRMTRGNSRIIIGVNNVDAQMRQKAALERARAERTTYSRIMALTGDFVCIYTVNPETDHFVEYSATEDYHVLGVPKQGERFFEEARRRGLRVVVPEDLERFLSLFTREKVLEAVRENGLFSLQYRLKMQEKTIYVNAKAAMVEEKDGPQLIIGLNNVTSQVERERIYADQLEQARRQANIDAVTGVRNRKAYVQAMEDITEQLHDSIQEGFAVVLFRVEELEKVRSSQGRAAENRLLRTARGIVCDAFKHSPVFRAEEDEFAALVKGRDYQNLERQLRQAETAAQIAGVDLRCGVGRWHGERDAEEVHKSALTSLREREG